MFSFVSCWTSLRSLTCRPLCACECAWKCSVCRTSARALVRPSFIYGNFVTVVQIEFYLSLYVYNGIKILWIRWLIQRFRINTSIYKHWPGSSQIKEEKKKTIRTLGGRVTYTHTLTSDQPSNAFCAHTRAHIWRAYVFGALINSQQSRWFRCWRQGYVWCDKIATRILRDKLWKCLLFGNVVRQTNKSKHIQTGDNTHTKREKKKCSRTTHSIASVLKEGWIVGKERST